MDLILRFLRQNSLAHVSAPESKIDFYTPSDDLSIYSNCAADIMMEVLNFKVEEEHTKHKDTVLFSECVLMLHGDVCVYAMVK